MDALLCQGLWWSGERETALSCSLQSTEPNPGEGSNSTIRQVHLHTFCYDNILIDLLISVGDVISQINCTTRYMECICHCFVIVQFTNIIGVLSIIYLKYSVFIKYLAYISLLN